MCILILIIIIIIIIITIIIDFNIIDINQEQQGYWLSVIWTCNSYGEAGLCWWICLAMASRTLDAEPTTAVTCKLVGVVST